jgi:spoIIIJ-associated protein
LGNVITTDEATASDTRVTEVAPQSEAEAAVTDDGTESTVEATEPAGGKSTAPGDATENPLDSEAEIAADYLEELLDIADLDGDIDTYIEGDRAHVSIVSESTVLVGDGGIVLDALQELTRLAVQQQTGLRSRLMLDVGGYRARRRTALAGIARTAAAEVASSGAPVRLDAMNPFERKVVHDAISAIDGVHSESEGEEPDRRVVVLPD